MDLGEGGGGGANVEGRVCGPAGLASGTKGVEPAGLVENDASFIF